MKKDQHQGTSQFNSGGRNRSDHLLSEISKKFLKVSSDEAYTELVNGLQLVVDSFGFGRGIIVELNRDRPPYSVTNQHITAGLKALFEKESVSEYLPCIDIITRGESLMFSNLPEDFPEEWTDEKEFCRMTGLRALLGIPLTVGGDVLGGLIFEDYHSGRDWTGPLLWRINMLCSIFSNVLARRKANLEARDALEFEMLLSSISNMFMDLPPGDVDKEITTALKKIVYFMDADRAAIVQYNENNELYHITHSYLRDGIVGFDMSRSDKDYPFLGDKLKKGRIVSFIADELPDEASVDRETLLTTGSKSGIWIPLMVTGNLIGMLSIGSAKSSRRWRKEFADRGLLFGQIFANALNRRITDVKLRTALTEIQQLKKQLEGDYAYLREEMEFEHDFHEIVGKSPQIRQVFLKIDMVANTDTSVLILGETGTGKELVARAIHEKSRRKNRPLIKLNCAALSRNIIESELFGHEKGAFTGADKKKQGRFEIANGASLFLDEIGELPMDLQAKLLRVIQEGEFERMGSTRTQKVDVRYIAATNRDLEEEVQKGRFRQDLLFRINVYPITMPPLRQHKDDIPLLVSRFVEKFSKKMGKPIKHVPRDVIDRLQKYDWPGNVRELENVIERAVITTKGNRLQVQDRFVTADTVQSLFPVTAVSGKPPSPAHWFPLSEIERDYILRVLEATKWRIDGPKGAAGILHLKPSTLRFRMKKLGIHRPRTHK